MQVVLAGTLTEAIRLFGAESVAEAWNPPGLQVTFITNGTPPIGALLGLFTRLTMRIRSLPVGTVVVWAVAKTGAAAITNARAASRKPGTRRDMVHLQV